MIWHNEDIFGYFMQLSYMRKCNVADSFHWIASGFKLYKKYFLIWTALLFCAGFCIHLVEKIPMVGQMAAQAILPFLTACTCVSAENANKGVAPSFKTFFIGLDNWEVRRALITLCCLNVLITSGGLWVLGAIFDKLPVFSLSRQGIGENLRSVFMVIIPLAVIVIVWASAFFAPALVAIDEHSPISALKFSLINTLRNLLTVFVFGILQCILLFVGFLLFGVGLIFAGPIMYLSYYFCFRGLFDSPKLPISLS